MATSQLSAADESRQPSTEHLTLRWFAKRSALWLLTVAAGIGAACFLYAYAADSDELNAHKTTAAAQQSVYKAP